jgi:hypothetical protein
MVVLPSTSVSRYKCCIDFSTSPEYFGNHLVHSVKQVPTLLANDEKLKDPTDVAKAFNNFFITIKEELNI